MTGSCMYVYDEGAQSIRGAGFFLSHRRMRSASKEKEKRGNTQEGNIQYQAE
jgi:hypothetical protein